MAQQLFDLMTYGPSVLDNSNKFVSLIMEPPQNFHISIKGLDEKFQVKASTVSKALAIVAFEFGIRNMKFNADKVNGEWVIHDIGDNSGYFCALERDGLIQWDGFRYMDIGTVKNMEAQLVV